jgi:dTMP kinase
MNKPSPTHNAVALGAFATRLQQRPDSGAGRLITIDGVDGSGKSSVVRGIVDELKARGLDAHAVDLMSPWVRKHPQFAMLAADLDSVVRRRADITALCSICIGDRLASWRTRYRELVRRGGWLVVDRYHLTPMSDMLVLGSEPPDQRMVRALLELLPRPDWAFLTDVDAPTTIRRVRSRPEEAAKVQRPDLSSRLVTTFAALAEVNDVVRLDTSGPVETAVAQAMSVIVR